ncbi:MAG: RHS repeat-associated core domain-containing protein, partial [Flavobacterium sp.]
YNGVKIDIEQDGWGRKTVLKDPSAGTFTYKNNDLGELETETSKNGEVVTVITRDSNGKPITKTVTGSGTETISIYEYDLSTKLLIKTTFKDKKEPAGSNEIITTYSYDGVYKRLLKIVEEKTGVSKFTTTLTYDGLGRIDTEEKKAELGSKNNTFTTKREYKNGALYQIVENISKKILWQANALNAKGELLESILGNGIKTTNEYDTNGYISKIRYDKTISGLENVLTLNTKFDFKTDNLDNRANSMFNNYTESFKYDEIDRLNEFTNKEGVKEIQNYEASGKIKDNSLGTYNYSKEKPYQNTSISLTPEAYGYYANREGNFKDGTTERKLDVTYNAFKSPLEITETTIDKISFTYNDNNQRSTMYYGSLEDKILRPLRKHYSADGTMEVKENIKTGSTEFIIYVGGDGYSAPIIARNNGVYTTPDIQYLHRDYQGTIMAITDANAKLLEKRLFDAWGSIIKVQDGAGNVLAGLTILDRGYTSHEHLQSVGLINMNARLYDPMIHRFLQVDNYIQDITNTQNYNQYGYVLNNPLKYTDPSGNAFNDGKDCLGCGGNNYPSYNPDKMQDNPLLADALKGWVDGWASARNFDKAGTAVGKATKDAVNFIGRNIRSLFGGSKNSGPPPNRSSYVNINSGNYSNGLNGMNNFSSQTTSATLQRNLLPQNYLIKLEGYNTTIFGNPKNINTNKSVTTDASTGMIDKSINYQLNLGALNGNFEFSGSSITLGAGLSASNRLYLGTSITLSADFFKSSNISINGYGDLNGDNKSSGFSAGIKPAGILFKFADIVFRRILPAQFIPIGIQYGTVIPIIGSQNQMY